MSWWSNVFHRKDEHQSLLETLQSLLHRQHDTIEHQGNVIAAIAAPPEAPTAPAAALAPVPATVAPQAQPRPAGAPTAAAAAPYTGPFYNIHGQPDPMGWYTADNWRKAADLQGVLSGTRFNGPVAFTEMTDDEKAFLSYATANYRFDPKLVSTQQDAWRAIGNGTLDEMNKAIADGDRLAGHGGYDPKSYQGRMSGYVDDVANGRLKPNVT